MTKNKSRSWYELIRLLIHNSDKLESDELAKLERAIRWREEARPNQLTPQGNWNTWLILAGRGWGKTRAAGEDIAGYCLMNPGVIVCVMAQTLNNCKQVNFKGESGLEKIIPKQCISNIVYSPRPMMTLTNGSTIIGAGAAAGEDSIRGYQFHRVWADELCAWDNLEEVYGSLELTNRLGVRQGNRPQMVISTTPKPHKMLVKMIDKAKAGDNSIVITRGSTYDNRANLAENFIKNIEERYRGSRFFKQELEAELLLDVSGALWSRELIQEQRVTLKITHKFDSWYMVVGVDPAATAKATSDHTGIILAGYNPDDKKIYIVEDASCIAKPTGPGGWGVIVAKLAKKYSARVIAETNQGGDMIESVIKGIDSSIRYEGVRATKNKLTRAEPVAVAYEQGKVHHLGHKFRDLEDEMCNFSGDTSRGNSPDRLDALVYAVTHLQNKFLGRGEILHLMEY